MRVKATIPFIWILTALLLSYSLDAECLLNLDGTCWQTCQQSSEDRCVEPPLLAGAPPALPTPTFHLELHQEPEEQLVCWPESWQVPLERRALTPVGLRAPPRTA